LFEGEPSEPENQDDSGSEDHSGSEDDSGSDGYSSDDGGDDGEIGDASGNKSEWEDVHVSTPTFLPPL